MGQHNNTGIAALYGRAAVTRGLYVGHGVLPLNNARRPEDQRHNQEAVEHQPEVCFRQADRVNLATKDAISFYTKLAFDVLETINISSSNKQILKDFGTELMTRDV